MSANAISELLLTSLISNLVQRPAPEALTDDEADEQAACEEGELDQTCRSSTINVVLGRSQAGADEPEHIDEEPERIAYRTEHLAEEQGHQEEEEASATHRHRQQAQGLQLPPIRRPRQVSYFLITLCFEGSFALGAAP